MSLVQRICVIKSNTCGLQLKKVVWWVVVVGGWIIPLHPLPRGLALTFDVDVDVEPDPGPELDNFWGVHQQCVTDTKIQKIPKLSRMKCQAPKNRNGP